MNLIGYAYVALFGVSGVVCLAAIPRARRFDSPDVRRGLIWLLATAGAWAMTKAAFLVLPDQFRAPAYTVGLAIGFGTVWAWLYFCSAYTGQDYHRNSTLRRLGAAVFLGVVAVKFTNPWHGLYFTTSEATTPFAYLAIEHGVFHWTATGLSYVLSAVGIFMLFQLYYDSGYDTRPLTGLTALVGLPVLLDIGAQFTSQVIDFIYAPIGVAAFAIGVLFVSERRFLAVEETRGDDLSIYLDERDRIRGHSPAAEDALPALGGATGDRLSEAVPAVADAIDGDEQILEREREGETRYYFVSVSNTTLGDAGTKVIQLSDVTRTERQRRQLIERERELDRQNERYRAIIDASFAFVFRIDLEGRFTLVSPSVEEFLGYSPAELEGQPISVTHPDEETTERAWEQIEPVLDGETNSVWDFPLETKSGTTVYTDTRGVPIYDGTVPSEERTPEDIVGIQLMVRDATERRQREGLISVINRVLRHNLRNRMTIINSYAGMLEADLDGEKAQTAAQIRATGKQLLDLSESARKIGENREQPSELEPVDLVPLLDRVVSQLELRYTDASVTVDAPDAVVAHTQERIETALWEIADNAAKHGGEQPTVEISVAVTERQVEIAITDDGPGLPDVEREVLESSTETQLVHGEGLGLWLVYWIVTGLEGEVDATSSAEGTTVTVRLPKRA
ncbi:MAG: ATP-binding protein [Halobacteriales archaeon]